MPTEHSMFGNPSDRNTSFHFHVYDEARSKHIVEF